MWNAISLAQDLNSCRRVHFPTTTTITPRAPPVPIFIDFTQNSKSILWRFFPFFPFFCLVTSRLETKYSWCRSCCILSLSFCFLGLACFKTIFIIIIYSLKVFHINVSWWSFHRSLSDSKSPQVSRTLLSIMTVLNNVVVWMVSTRPPTSKSFSPFSSPLVTVPKAPIIIGRIVTLMFHYYYYYSNYSSRVCNGLFTEAA